MPTSNSPDTFRWSVGKTVVTVIFDGLPHHRPDIAKGTKALVFDAAPPSSSRPTGRSGPRPQKRSTWPSPAATPNTQPR